MGKDLRISSMSHFRGLPTSPSTLTVHGRRQRLRLLRRGDGIAALLPGVPPLARGALFIGAQLGAVLIADEPGARAAGPVRAPFHAAAHVEGPARPRRLGGKPHDALRGPRRGKLAFRLQSAVALEDAALLGRGKLARVLLAEPPVARSGPRLPAAGHRAEPPRTPAVEPHPPGCAADLHARKRGGYLLLHLPGNDRGQLAREPIDHRAKRRILRLICH